MAGLLGPVRKQKSPEMHYMQESDWGTVQRWNPLSLRRTSEARLSHRRRAVQYTQSRSRPASFRVLELGNLPRDSGIDS